MARVSKSSLKYPYGYSEFGGKKHRLTKSGNVDLRTVSPAQKANYKRMASKFIDAKKLIKTAIKTLGDETEISFDKIKDERLNYDDLNELASILNDDLQKLQNEYEDSLEDVLSDDEDDRDVELQRKLEMKLDEISDAVSKMQQLKY